MTRSMEISTTNKAFVFGCILLFALSALTCSSRKGSVVSLNGTWLFKIDSTDVGLSEEWFRTSLDRSDWKQMEIPGSWDRYGLEGYDGVGWYFRSVELSDTSKEIALFFGGVDDNADVWVNGHQVGSHTGYSESFFFDVTEKIISGKNEIVVRVKDNSGPGGIYKRVSIGPAEEVEDLLRSEFSKRNARTSADWVKDAIVYEVYLRSFSNKGFKGLEERVPELKQLGVTVLWLMPIHPIGDANRKGTLGSPYSIQDYYEVNPEFGTLDDFRSLVRTVHDNGLKIIIDLVANHAAWDSKLMFEHSDWFTSDDSGAVVSPNPDWSDVADLNYDHHELRKYMISMMKYWVEDVGVDGFRCDVAELVPTEFWIVARRELDDIKPVMMLSEGTLPEHHIEAFDMTYSWSTYDVLEKVLFGSTPVSVFDNILKHESYQFPRGSLRLRFNTNHDKNAWDAPAVKKFGGAGALATMVLEMTLPGVPLIYNGEEVGNDRSLSLFEQVNIDWNRNPSVRTFYHDLCAFRNNHVALRRGEYVSLSNTGGPKVLTFERKTQNERVLVAINFSGTRQSVSVTLPEKSPTQWVDFRSTSPMEVVNELLSFELSPQGFMILTPTEESL